jgi:hypothetical protein
MQRAAEIKSNLDEGNLNALSHDFGIRYVIQYASMPAPEALSQAIKRCDEEDIVIWELPTVDSN